MKNNENEFKHLGKTYVAEDASKGRFGIASCKECSAPPFCAAVTVECDGFKRKDNRDVIFKERV